MENRMLKTFYNEITNNCFKLIANFARESLQLILLEDSCAWTADVSNKVLEDLSKQNRLSFDDYCNTLKLYLQEVDENITFLSNKKEFIINKVINHGKMAVKFFRCAIKEVEYSGTVESLLDSFHSELKETSTKLQTLESERNELKKCETELKKKLLDFEANKKNEEEQLYNSFILLLNEKKMRIQHLYELLEAFKKGRSPTNPVIENKKLSEKRNKNVENKKDTKIKNFIMSDSESNEENENVNDESDQASTDEEKNYFQSSKSIPEADYDSRENNVKPNTSKQFLDDLFSDDSLPTHALPKRVRKSPNGDSDTVKIRDSNYLSTKEIPKRSNSKDIRTEEPKETDKSQVRETINLDTQDLLDLDF